MSDYDQKNGPDMLRHLFPGAAEALKTVNEVFNPPTDRSERIKLFAEDIYEAMKDLLMGHQGSRIHRERARDLIHKIELKTLSGDSKPGEGKCQDQ